MSVIVIADTVANARTIARGLASAGARATSPCSIRRGFGRGCTATDILVDDSAWPLADDVRDAIAPCLLGSSGRIHRRRDA